jgi:hypothetical protein
MAGGKICAKTDVTYQFMNGKANWRSGYWFKGSWH